MFIEKYLSMKSISFYTQKYMPYYFDFFNIGYLRYVLKKERFISIYNKN